MSSKSFLYKNSWLYTNLLKLFHGKNFEARYKYMASQIGPKMSVFEPGSGPGIISSYLDSSCTYRGFDVNKDFVNDAKKDGVNIKIGNILNRKSYKNSDVSVLVDVLHHLRVENQRILLENTLAVTGKKIIICEPFMHKFHFVTNIPLFYFFLKKFFEFMEQDGNNETRIEHIHSKKKLREKMKKGFGVIPTRTKKEIRELGDDLIVTYYL